MLECWNRKIFLTDSSARFWGFSLNFYLYHVLRSLWIDQGARLINISTLFCQQFIMLEFQHPGVLSDWSWTWNFFVNDILITSVPSWTKNPTAQLVPSKKDKIIQLLAWTKYVLSNFCQLHVLDFTCPISLSVVELLCFFLATVATLMYHKIILWRVIDKH